MSVNSNRLKEFVLHLLERFWVSVLEIAERLPEPKNSCAVKWSKDHGEGIELSPTAEVVNRHPRQRETPPSAA